MSAIVTRDPSELESVVLKRGKHNSPEQGMCINEAVAWFAHEPHSDRPPCMSYTIGTATMAYNDRVRTDAERTKYLRGLIPELVGTNTGPADERTRQFMVADWVVRQRTPGFLRLAGLTAEAELLEGLARIVDDETLTIARQRTQEVRTTARRFRDARWSELKNKYPSIAIASASASDIAIASAIASDIAIAIASASAIAIASASASDIASDIASAIASDIASDIAIASAIAIASDIPSVHKDAIRAAFKAALANKNSYWTRYYAARDAADAVYNSRPDEAANAEWPVTGKWREEVERQREGFVALIRAMCAVGRKAA